MKIYKKEMLLDTLPCTLKPTGPPGSMLQKYAKFLTTLSIYLMAVMCTPHLLLNLLSFYDTVKQLFESK